MGEPLVVQSSAEQRGNRTLCPLLWNERIQGQVFGVLSIPRRCLRILCSQGRTGRRAGLHKRLSNQTDVGQDRNRVPHGCFVPTNFKRKSLRVESIHENGKENRIKLLLKF